MSGDDSGDARYLYVVEYEEDAERKRAEYLFKNWDEGSIDRPDGLVRIVEGVAHEELYEQLIAKVPAEQVTSYELEPIEADVEVETVVVEETVDASVDAVEAFLEYILSKRKAVLQSASRNEYEVYSKKGRAEVSYDVTDGERVAVRIRVDGYPPAPAFIAEFFETELADYAASQSSE
jgi:hypothetical protein